MNQWLHSFFFNPANAENAATSDGLFMFILWVCIVSFVGLMGLMFYFAWKYRRMAGVAPQVSPAHHTMLEITWSVAPLIILVIIFFWGFHGYVKTYVTRADAEEIVIRGYKWAWEATYANGALSPEFTTTDADRKDGDSTITGNVQIPVFVVPAGRPIKLRMSSSDVIHSFYVPAFRIKTDVFPNRYTSMSFTAMQAGQTHDVFCAEYCGTNHSEMAAKIRVVSEEEYAATLIQWADVIKPGARLHEVGALLYKQKGCALCHTLDGSKSTGPTWKNMYGYEQPIVGGSPVLADANFIRESIYMPAAKIVEGYANQMQSYQGQISDRELEALIAYMRSLSDKGNYNPDKYLIREDKTWEGDAEGKPTP